jgi:hypothetical protein
MKEPPPEAAPILHWASNICMSTRRGSGIYIYWTCSLPLREAVLYCVDYSASYGDGVIIGQCGARLTSLALPRLVLCCCRPGCRTNGVTVMRRQLRRDLLSEWLNRPQRRSSDCSTLPRLQVVIDFLYLITQMLVSLSTSSNETLH